MDNLEQIEALLFVGGDEGISLAEIEKATGFMRPAINLLIEKLRRKYHDDPESALAVLQSDEIFRLATKQELGSLIKRYYEAPLTTPLSQASLEVLAIIAYRQPITRIEIDDIRGVQSSGTIQKLVLRNLIVEAGRLDVAGRPFLYKTTDYFMDYFGLSSLSDLPPLTDQAQLTPEDVTGDLFVAALKQRQSEESNGTTTKSDG